MRWQVWSDSDVAGDFLGLSGSVTLLEGQREAEIVLALMPDTVPELEEVYSILLTAVEGGATLDQDPDLIKTHIRFVAIDRHDWLIRGKPKLAPHPSSSLNPQGAC